MQSVDFYSLPQALYTLEGVKPLLKDANNAILYKRLKQESLDMQKIVVSHSIVYVMSGTVSVTDFAYQETRISAGEMMFMPKNSYLISDYLQDGEDMQVYLFFFDFEIASKFLGSIHVEGDKAPSVLQLNSSKNISAYINTLKSIQYQNSSNAQLVELKLLELLHLLHEVNPNFANALKATQLHDEEMDIVEMMQKHYDKNLRIDDWAHLAGVSSSTFSRRFKSRYKMSIKQWMLQQNMQLAFSMLRHGKSVRDCADAFGYSNSSNFIEAYKRVHQKTPKQHVQENQCF